MISKPLAKGIDVIAHSRRREFELWARIAEKQIMTTADLTAWGAWIAENGQRLGECEQFNPAAYATVKAAINESQKRFPS